MDFVSIITALIGGTIGGNIAGPATQEKNLGFLGNTISGIIGGTAGTYILQALGIITAITTGAAVPAVTGTTPAEMDWSAILATLGASGGFGAAVTAIVAYAKDAMNKKG